MLRALMLIFDPSRGWEAVKSAQHPVWRVSLFVLLPLLILTCAGEAAGLRHFGIRRGDLMEKLTPASWDLVLRYELMQIALTLVIAYLGAIALKTIGASFQRRHTYTECFTMLAYSLTPLLLLRMLDGVPAIETWACYGIGIFLTLSLLYRGIPFIMRPDPSSALGLFMFSSFILLGTTGLSHFVALSVLQEKILACNVPGT